MDTLATPVEEESPNTPHDQIQYREYKILLKPDRFTSPAAYEDYWDIVRRVAKDFDVKIAENDHPFVNQVRAVLFYDTANFDLYNNHFIARLRTLYQNGWPIAVPELTVKFRHPDFQTAADVNIHPATEGAHRIKFKEELLPMRDRLGAMRSVYSHNCILAIPRVNANLAITDITRIFPAFKAVPANEGERVALVNDVSVEELQANVGVFKFGHGVKAKATVAVWRKRAIETTFCGEFAFQVKFDREDELHAAALKKADEFYKAMQIEAGDWVLLGSTKTALIYGQGDMKTTNAE